MKCIGCLLLTSPFAAGLWLASDVDSGARRLQHDRLPYWCCGKGPTLPTGSSQVLLPDTDNHIPWSWEGASLSRYSKSALNT